MINSLSNRYRRLIAYPLFIVFTVQIISPLSVLGESLDTGMYYQQQVNTNKRISNKSLLTYQEVPRPDHFIPAKKIEPVIPDLKDKSVAGVSHIAQKPTIGGPSAPEANTFKAVGSNNLVNLFSGDFSYSIPLLDVGGYPVNLFYSGGITMEQEASWVGLGWNINPGTVSRNMRGVPDDFNGEDKLIQHQNVKPNRTWGGSLGLDAELLGIKKPNGSLSVGLSYNNYLGPAIEIGASTSLSLVTVENLKYSKSANMSLGLVLQAGAKLNSRSGLTFSPSLNLNTDLKGQEIKSGIGLNTSYDSRSGVSNLNLHSELEFYKDANTGKNSVSASLGNNSFSFAKPSYIPTLRMPMANGNYAAQLDIGLGSNGIRHSGVINAYYSFSKVPREWQTLQKPLVGFMYSEKAMDNKDAVMDFNRLNDGVVTPNTPVISAPQYSYDIFAIQGEGTGGSIRAYRSELGYMKDNLTVSKDNSFSLGGDIASIGHFGGNLNFISSPTKAGSWDGASNTLNHSMQFKPDIPNHSFENIYFKNPGEATVVNSEMLNLIGGEDLVRFKLGGSKVNPRLESALETFDKNTKRPKGFHSIVLNDLPEQREKRTQVTTMLTAEEATVVGLEKSIRNYSGTFNTENEIQYAEIPRVGDYRKSHHISEIDVLEQSGMRYIYGLPVYSKIQKDFTFSVGSLPANEADNLVAFTESETSVNSPHMANNSRIDGYVQTQVTPAYATAFLLTGLLSPDYVDITGDGITEDDMGGAVKFNYQKSSQLHKWRTPRNNSGGQVAHFNEGIKTEKKDNKAVISYGEREAWYLNSIESKSMVAIFKTEDRNDAKGVVSDINGAININEQANKKLSRIDLYTKAEIQAKGIALAKPIKSVIFNYDSSLCIGTPDSKNGGGKLTLKSVYFTYNGQPRLEKDKYVFNYGNLSSAIDNPSYSRNASDRWGTYKNPDDPAVHPDGLTNKDYPYTDYNHKSKNDEFAGAWNLKKILLPSGAQMEMEYEADDYAYVQDRRACNMMNIYGLGSTKNYAAGNALYNNGLSSEDNFYVYIQLTDALTQTDPAEIKNEIQTKYLEGIEQLAFKLTINMPKGPEPLTMYADYEDFGLCTNSVSNDYIYIKLKPLNGKSPLATSAIGFLTENIPGQAFPGYEAHLDGVMDVVGLFTSMLGSLKDAFKNVDQQIRSRPFARTIDLDRSFIRLNDPDLQKFGGGYRVKRIVVKDNWNKMTNQFTSMYGQDYDYTTTGIILGETKIISSGVASYEPGIGSEENPFRGIIQYSDKMPLASAQYGAIEVPVLEGLYPSPMVGYSKVTVRSIHRNGQRPDTSLRSAIGKQVTEFYTAKEFPARSSYTPMNSQEYKKNPFFSFLYKEIISRRTISQGFLVETNDMHGKIKSQAAFSESDETTPLTASYHTYKNTGKNGFNDKIDFVYNEESGTIKKGNIGIDVELMTDVREFKIESFGINAQSQADIFFLVPLPPFAIFTLFPLHTYQENIYKAVSTTKLINYHAIEDSVIVMDKGSVISTKTIAYDSETGSPIVTRTANEFKDPVYNVNYPAYWAYSGTGPAYKNIGQTFSEINFDDGKILNSNIDQDLVFESGDELYITDQGSGSPDCLPPSNSLTKIWAFDKNKNETALTVNEKDFIFLDSAGNAYTKSGVSFKIIRSGKRNMLGLTVASATCMANPIRTVTGVQKLVLDDNSKAVNTSAVLFKEKWQADQDAFLYKAYYPEACTGIELDSLSCNGILEKSINPYLRGLVGNFKPYRNYIFYGDRMETNPATATNIRKDGYLKDLEAFWNFDTDNNLVPDLTNTDWVWNSELTKVNTKGQTLEVKDPLNRYNAMQYGFNKNLAVASVNNARYGESFYEGFEDEFYTERINPGNGNICLKKFIDFSGLAGGAIDNGSVIAHTGKNVLKINSNSTLSRSLPLNPFIDSFDFEYSTGDIITFIAGNDGTGQETYVNPTPQYPGFNYPVFSFSNLNMSAGTDGSQTGITGPKLAYSGTNSNYLSNSATTQWIKIITPGNYNFTLNAMQVVSELGSPPPQPLFNRASITLSVKTIGGATLLNKNLYSDVASSASHSVYLDCGIYLISCAVGSDVTMPGNYTSLHEFDMEVSYTSDVVGITGSYISCTYNKPIPAKDSMLNPEKFSLVPGKRMYFSAWVKEDCSIPCTKLNYDLSDVDILCNGVSVAAGIRHTGPIIDGWQKIEGEFTVPAGATSAELKFINTNNAPMYADDIRMHPFNANMKSFVYDPRTLRLVAELDENNYATLYEYDEEGQLVRLKKETVQGIKTIKETRSAKQKTITDILP